VSTQAADDADVGADDDDDDDGLDGERARWRKTTSARGRGWIRALGWTISYDDAGGDEGVEWTERRRTRDAADERRDERTRTKRKRERDDDGGGGGGERRKRGCTTRKWW
jgi:hypothetical protein